MLLLVRSINTLAEVFISCGVPQSTCSISGPLLFHLYFNDFKNCSAVFEFHIFVDNANLFLTQKNLSELEQVVNIHLSKVSEWLSSKRLSLNVKKTNFVLFCSPQKKVSYSLNLYLNLVAIKHENCIRYVNT